MLSLLAPTVRRSVSKIPATLLRSFSTLPSKCPACSSPLPSPLPTCTRCYHIEPLPNSVTHFDLFEIPSSQNRFRLDVKDLKRRFLLSQRVCHPDAWSSRGQKVHGIAEAQSSWLNTAYKTLLSPVLRAQYILTLEGFPPSETDKLTDSEFITGIMETREQLEEAATSEEVERIRAKNDTAVEEVYNEIAKLVDDRNWKEARDAAVKAKYLEGIEDAAKDRWHALSQ